MHEVAKTPHPGELIDQREYRERRLRVLQSLDDDSIALVAAAPRRIRSQDTCYPYRQNSDLLYLTGFCEPQAVLALIPGGSRGESVLFCREHDAREELWMGARLGTAAASAALGVDAAFPITEIDDVLPELMVGRGRLYCALGAERQFDQQVLSWAQTARAAERYNQRTLSEFLHLGHVLHEMRLHKSAAELALMRTAAQITVAAHERVLQLCRPGMMEARLEAELLHAFHCRGARAPAYESIVAGGDNACIMHYTANAECLRDGDLVLVDAGCEYGGYAADLTSTFPVNGGFSGEQRALYDLVLAAERAAISVARSGLPFDRMHEVVIRELTKGLLYLGLLEGELEELVETEACARFSIHKSGHWLGLDVHDVGVYRTASGSRPLEPGMVLTVEPGLYFPSSCQEVPPAWRGMGVRIEDDVAVTETLPEVLSADLPRDADEIERLMAS